MKREIFNDLIKRYYAGKEILKGLQTTEDDPIFAYDFRLLTIGIRGIDEDDENATRLLDLRCRKNKEKDCEELVIVTGNKGAVRDVTNIEEDLKGAAEVIEIITAGLVENFPDDVLVWSWLGD